MARRYDNVGAYHLAQNPELYEPARTNNFLFVVTGLDTLLYAGVDANANISDDKKYIKNASDTLRVAVVSSSVPDFSLSTIEVKSGNSSMKVAGVPTFEAGNIVINDFIGARTKDILLAWKALAYDVKNQLVQKMSNYKREAYLIELAPDNTEIRKLHMYGVWVSDVTGGDFNVENNDKRTVQATIQYDYMIPELPEN